MSHQIKTMYVVHHSHTDIGYTDLQEHVIHGQVSYIRSALQLMEQPENLPMKLPYRMDLLARKRTG
mgnify:CR=1 FL=1